MIQNKLVESWLDNQGERRYQPALIQLLISEGWTVLHNTRHSPIEFGKDVIARSPDGKLCALQLKGNPGSRLTKSEAQSLLPQFLEAMESAIPESYGRRRNERHRTIIVTNGEIDEEARELFDRTAVRVENPLCSSDSVAYWSRGELLARFSAKVQSIWPSTIEGLGEAVRMFSESGLAIPTPSQIIVPLSAAFGMSNSNMKAPEKSSKITSIFLLTEVLKSPWYRTANHYALFQISILATAYALQFADAAKRVAMVEAYAGIALAHAVDLVNECEERGFDPQYNDSVQSPLSEVDIFPERARLIADVVAALTLANRLGEIDRGYARKLISGSVMPGCLWGQFVIPSMIIRHWAWRRLDASMLPEQSLVSLFVAYIGAAENHSLPDQVTNAAPYYRFEEVLHSNSKGLLGIESDISQDDTRNHMYFGKAVLQMLALRNWKQSCKSIWRRFSMKMHGSTEVGLTDFYSPLISNTGSTTSEQFYSKTWVELVNDGIDANGSSKVEAFQGLDWVLAAYLCIAPHRAEHNVLMTLDARLNANWYSKLHRPGDPILK